MTTLNYRTTDVEGLKVFYREAGRADAPMLLLLHGFPSAGHMFRDLIPQLADRFHVIAPDLPGFGQSDMPERTKFSYTFHHIAGAVDRFTEVIGFGRFAIYVFDYGAPTGFRLAVRHPERITAIISQNGNAYVEGLSDGWNPIRAYWQGPVRSKPHSPARLSFARDNGRAVYVRRPRYDLGFAGRILPRQLLLGAPRRGRDSARSLRRL